MAIDTVTVTGVIGTAITHTVTQEGLAISSFRLVSQQRKYDRTQGSWVDAEANWFTVTAFRTLALNAAVSLDKGQRVIVAGKLRVRTWRDGEITRSDVEILADSLGHDLLWGTTVFSRPLREADSAAPAALRDVSRAEPPF